MTWFGWLGLVMMVVFGYGGLAAMRDKMAGSADLSAFFGLATFGFALLVWGAVAY